MLLLGRPDDAVGIPEDVVLLPEGGVLRGCSMSTYAWATAHTTPSYLCVYVCKQTTARQNVQVRNESTYVRTHTYVRTCLQACEVLQRLGVGDDIVNRSFFVSVPTQCPGQCPRLLLLLGRSRGHGCQRCQRKEHADSANLRPAGLEPKFPGTYAEIPREGRYTSRRLMSYART